MYSVEKIIAGLTGTLHQYLEAAYHIWDESLILARQDLLAQENITSSDPRLEASPTYLSAGSFDQMEIPRVASNLLVRLSKVKKSGVYLNPRTHQKIALEQFIGQGNEIVVATGTGSGKTECFLYPIIGALAMEGGRDKASVQMSGCRFLLLYPMNALVNDQLTRLRKMFGNEDVAAEILSARGRRATFGVYTSKTDYPGKRENDKDKKLQKKIKQLYTGESEDKKQDLWNEGLWPAKDMHEFLRSDFKTSQGDSELYTRHEIQTATPDIVITNYSMLEYMLARPIERGIFDITSEWLHADPDNYLTIVLDEAHMYRGVVGAEVSFLLRRLQSRLKVSRDKIKYILTSASLGSTEEDRKKVIEFAKALTGKPDGANPFTLVQGEKERKQGEALPSILQLDALSDFDINKLHQISDSLTEAKNEVEDLFIKMNLGKFSTEVNSIYDLKDALYKKLEIFPPAAYLANTLTKKPVSYESLSSQFLGGYANTNPIETLIALCTFAQLNDDSQQVFLPVRLHLMYRGIPGLFACINPNCSERMDLDKKSLLGKVFTHPVLNCKCGGRVFEVLTHRDCGAAFIKGYVSKNSQGFLLHEQARVSSDDKLTEAHFLVEPKRAKRALINYIHIYTGKISENNPNSSDFIPIAISDKRDVLIRGREVFTFPKKCPVCSRGLLKNGYTKIQDLATKGEDPFSYLVRAQVIDQPPSKEVNKAFPLKGRKTLVFSDGRQKAARLARDIPRTVEKDIFRICISLAVDYLNKNIKNPSLKTEQIYVAFLIILHQKNIILFDGNDKERLTIDLRQIKAGLEAENEIKDIIDESSWTAPETFKQLLLTNLWSPYYSLSALTIGSIYPTKKSLHLFSTEMAKYGLSDQDSVEISTNWLTKITSDPQFSYDKDIAPGTRRAAIGYRQDASDWGAAKGDHKRLSEWLSYLDAAKVSKIEDYLFETFCISFEGKFYVNPAKVTVNLNSRDSWHQCLDCTKLSFLSIRGLCPHCNSSECEDLNPHDSQYLRARKQFYRDPVIKALEPNSEIFNLTVEEHTAQLSNRDEYTHVSSNETFERRFKDILIYKNEIPVDILSCTTTMEVGVDIGSLIAVSMRNVPPERQNYQQRAGRAGRRGSAISTVVTYAQTGSHDSHYFENPDAIISGDPQVPEIDTTNNKVITRHVIAEIIQSYFHRENVQIDVQNNDLMSVLGLTKSFYENEGDFNFDSLKKWLGTEFITDGVRSDIASWAQSLVDVNKVTENLILALESRPDFSNDKSYDEKFLNYLFSCDFLPSYAFPRHVCSFQIEKRLAGIYRSATVIESPQQGLSNSLTEYAPGRLVVVNKKTYKIGSITAKSSGTEKNRAVRLFEKKKQYLQCPDCLYTENLIEGSPNRNKCTHCGNESMKVLDVVQPEVVYPDGRMAVNEFNDDDLYTSASSAQLPFNMSNEETAPKKFREKSVISYKSNQELVIINKGDSSEGFWVCNLCGKASAEIEKPEGPHERDYFVIKTLDDQICNGVYTKVNTGFSFNSDVFLMRVSLESPMLEIGTGIEKDGLITAARTLSEAMTKVASQELQINPSEMNCGVRFLKIDGVSNMDIFIYDTAAGGAGYANMTGKYIEKIFSEVRVTLTQGCCETSCYRCLQNYGNRFYHNNLDKNYGLMLWDFLSKGLAPKFYLDEEQFEISSQLRKLLELEGWTVIRKENFGFSTSLGGKEITVVLYPVLLDLDFVKHAISADVYISDYEVQKSLPSAYLKVASH
jgi:ATP-dependent helicase YprA (DUF1998 family)/Zn finger protein HypA/HybF involved in hydrogenase expression